VFKKIIQILSILILLIILLLIIIFVFNPANLRNKTIGEAMNVYLTHNLKNYTHLNTQSVQPAPTNKTTDKNPLLTEQQEKTLESYGVEVSQLPTEITPSMQNCFVDILGEARATEFANGATPTALEVIKAGKCLGE
jgi:hypothetical protein